MKFKGGIPPESFLKRMSPEDRRPLGKAGVTSAEAQAKSDAISERELQNQIENWFRLNGIPAFRQRMDRKSTMVIGCPDFLVCWNGKFVALECKVGNNQPTTEQEDCLMAIQNAGGQSFVIRSLKQMKDLFTLNNPKLETEGV